MTWNLTTFGVQQRSCSSCIYRKDSPLDIKELEAQIADPNMRGYFKGYRVCHHSPNKTCCRGFWNRHKNKFNLGQIAIRLGLVQFVNDDFERNNMEDLFTVCKGKRDVKCRFVEMAPGDVRVYKVEYKQSKNWSVTVGRKWPTRFEALAFLKEKGWVVQVMEKDVA
jgi:hypothetical protein